MDDELHDGPAARPHRWDPAPLDESLHGARELTVSVVDRSLRDGWERLAAVVGMPARRWRSHHPIGPDERLVRLVDGAPALDAAAWERFVSLVPGAVALPSRTATSFGVARSALHPPDRRVRIIDLIGARRRRRRLARAWRDIEAAHARLRFAIDTATNDALAPGDDGTPLDQLPPYALAARLDGLLAAGATWELPAVVDLLSVEATMYLVAGLRARGRTPADALLEASMLSSGGGITVPDHLAALAAAAVADGDLRSELLDTWRTSVDGWHAMRDLVLEAPPLRDATNDVLLDLATHEPPPAAAPVVELRAADDPELAALVERARALTARREAVARDRASWFAAIRCIAWTLAARLQRDGAIARADHAFDLTLDQLRAAARGAGAPRHVAPIEPHATTRPEPVAAIGPVELRGIPASPGVASGRVVVVDDPLADVDLDGCVLVCRSTDPAWMPLLLRSAGLVTERGGPLSHASIVARELALPAVVGAAGALVAARGASSATVDGGTGIVTLRP